MSLTGLAHNHIETSAHEGFNEIVIVSDDSLHIRLIHQLLANELTQYACYVRSDVAQVSESSIVLLSCQNCDENDLIAVLTRLFEKSAKIPVLLINGRSEMPLFRAAEMPNVRGVFEAHCEPIHLVSAMTKIAEGGVWLPRHYSDYLMMKLRVQPVKKQLSESALTRRELQILTLVTKGCSNEDVAEKLVVSANTVKTHLYRVYKKIGVNNRYQAVEWLRQFDCDAEYLYG